MPAIGGDKVAIGAASDSSGATDAGAAYLFSIDGALNKTGATRTSRKAACAGASTGQSKSHRAEGETAEDWAGVSGQSNSYRMDSDLNPPMAKIGCRDMAVTLGRAVRGKTGNKGFCKVEAGKSAKTGHGTSGFTAGLDWTDRRTPGGGGGVAGGAGCGGMTLAIASAGLWQRLA